MFMATLDNLVMTNALPVLHAEFGASVEELQWFMNAYTLAFASTILMAVALGDRFGRRTLFVIGIVVFTLSSAFAALAPTRASSSSPAPCRASAPRRSCRSRSPCSSARCRSRRRPLAIGIWGGVAGLGVATGPLIGGAVLEGWDWQAIFWINVPVGVISVALALIALPNSFGARLRADIVGLVLSGLGVLGVVYGIVRGNDAGWDSFEVLGSLIGGGVLLVAFVALGGAGRRRRCCRCGCSATAASRSRTSSGFGFSFGAFGSIFILIQFLQVVQGATPLEAALQTTPWTLAPMVVAPLAGFIAPRVGTRALIVAGLARARRRAVLAQRPARRRRSRTRATCAPFIVAGIGMGLVFAPSVDGRARGAWPPDDHGQGERHQLDAARGRRRTRHRRVDRGVHRRRRRSSRPTDYSIGAQPAVLVGAAVLIASALVALLLPAGRGSEHIEPATSGSEPATSDADLVAAVR